MLFAATQKVDRKDQCEWECSIRIVPAIHVWQDIVDGQYLSVNPVVLPRPHYAIRKFPTQINGAAQMKPELTPALSM